MKIYNVWCDVHKFFLSHWFSLFCIPSKISTPTQKNIKNEPTNQEAQKKIIKLKKKIEF